MADDEEDESLIEMVMKKKRQFLNIEELLDSVYCRPLFIGLPRSLHRNRRGNGDWKFSTWSRILIDPSYRDPIHYNGKTFRRRFRVPFVIFEKILSLCESAKSFEDETKLLFAKAEIDCCGQETVPISLLILGCLRILGRGMCMDGINELTNISMEVHRVFFHKFCFYFANKLFDVYCGPPTTEEEISSVTRAYGLLGFPGCIGSVDCVHVAWDRAPHLVRWKYIGKEHYPTVAYEVTCTHARKIISCSSGFPGSHNDKTIVRFDEFVTALNTKKMYSDIKFPVKNELGVIEMLVGLYLICDNGYHRWRCLQNPEKWSNDEYVIAFSRHLESIRKDIECCFGILKGRWRILKIPVLFQSQSAVDNIFKTCCVLHNIILTFDGLDKRWEETVKWDGVDGEHCFQDLGKVITVSVGSGRGNDWIRRLEMRVTASLDLSANNRHYSSPVLEDVEFCESHTLLRQKLIVNFKKQMEANEVQWF